jgi:hypothetical protein
VEINYRKALKPYAPRLRYQSREIEKKVEEIMDNGSSTVSFFLHVHTITLQKNHIKIEQHCMEWPLLLPLWLSCPIHKKNALSNLPTNFSFRSFSILLAYIYSCHKPTIYILKQLLMKNLINYIQRLNFQYCLRKKCLRILFLSVQEEGKASREKLLYHGGGDAMNYFEHLI